MGEDFDAFVGAGMWWGMEDELEGQIGCSFSRLISLVCENEVEDVIRTCDPTWID